MKQFIAFCGLDCETCGDCPEMRACEKVGAIISNNGEALRNLM